MKTKLLVSILAFLFIRTSLFGQYEKILDFEGATNGSNAYYGSLASDGTFLYGMTEYGGINNIGVIFKIMPDGSGYVKLLDFDGTLHGSYPAGSLIYINNFLYGMAANGEQLALFMFIYWYQSRKCFTITTIPYRKLFNINKGPKQDNPMLRYQSKSDIV